MAAVNNDTGNNIYADLGLTRPKQDNQAKKNLGQNEFLTLMTAQLKHQDPFQPMESGQFLGQMAQFGTVNGIQQLQDSFKGLSDSLYSNQALQASSLVGRSALVKGDGASIAAGGKMQGVVDLPSSVTDLTLTITDGAGQIVRRVDMGTAPQGMRNFEWDGTTQWGSQAPAGNYKVKAEATVGGQYTALGTLIYGNIESVDLGQGGTGITVNLAGLGAAAFSDVKQVK